MGGVTRSAAAVKQTTGVDIHDACRRLYVVVSSSRRGFSMVTDPNSFSATRQRPSPRTEQGRAEKWRGRRREITDAKTKPSVASPDI